MNILERFLKYVSIDTTSDSTKEDNPSTEKQKQLAEVLIDELRDLNLSDIYYDSKHCYVYAKLPGMENLPKIGFIAHMDTSESSKGSDINPNIINNYNGEDISLNESIMLKVSENPDLNNHIGKTLITTDGTTLLGADDKAGIAEIMDMLQTLTTSNENHGDIFVCFTPDEEIGLGTLHIDKNHFHPDFAYTVDGSSVGEFSYQNFNAATAIITIQGVQSHCGHAKGKMTNAGRIATLINALLPEEEIPERTDGLLGFYHLASINGNVSKASMKYLIRDFDSSNFEKRKELLTNIVAKLNEKYENCISLDIKDSYHNMYEVINQNPNLISETFAAITNTGISPIVLPIRGGTDGAEISYKGIPCPNLGTGGHNFHSVYEYICLEDMIKSSEILLSIVRQFSKPKDKVKQKSLV